MKPKPESKIGPTISVIKLNHGTSTGYSRSFQLYIANFLTLERFVYDGIMVQTCKDVNLTSNPRKRFRITFSNKQSEWVSVGGSAAEAILRRKDFLIPYPIWRQGCANDLSNSGPHGVLTRIVHPNNLHLPNVQPSPSNRTTTFLSLISALQLCFEYSCTCTLEITFTQGRQFNYLILDPAISVCTKYTIVASPCSFIWNAHVLNTQPLCNCDIHLQ